MTRYEILKPLADSLESVGLPSDPREIVGKTIVVAKGEKRFSARVAAIDTDQAEKVVVLYLSMKRNCRGEKISHLIVECAPECSIAYINNGNKEMGFLFWHNSSFILLP